MASRKLLENWDDYRYFLAVAQTGTLSAAAERLGTEHTTVSRRIRSLESGLNSRLFHKSTTGYVLTPEGERVLEVVQGVESAFHTSRAIAAADADAVEGIVRIGAPDGFGSIFLAPRIPELSAMNPRLEIEILAAPRIFSLWKQEADIAISLSGAQHLRVASRRLTDYRMFVYGSRTYLDHAEPIRAIQDFRKHPFVGYVEAGLFAPELNYLHAIDAGIQPRIRSSALLPQVFATAAGHGLGILPAYVAESFPHLVAVLPAEFSLTRSFHMHMHEDHRKAAHIRVVANFIAKVVQDNVALFMRDA
ncbi:LysR family transcriptional regulator [Burkholderia sp. Bp9142]|uniref:LysR family transcriptional regulator n=1 Tax=Burkholderia sp. Bp9142 TaxID=2184573 RepID=UPI0021AB9A9C|nr:LysR family transcriptional regulator [Burkholderia sp. Bp9142]